MIVFVVIDMRIGIDPGVKGAIAVMSGRQVVKVIDMPTYKHEVGGKLRSMIDVEALSQWLSSIKTALKNEVEVILEAQRPNAGNTGENARLDSPLTAFSIGKSYGMLYATVALVFGEENINEVYPISWKSRAGLVKTKKIDSINHCLENFDTGNFLTKKGHDGRADAINIAYYGL